MIANIVRHAVPCKPCRHILLIVYNIYIHILIGYYIHAIHTMDTGKVHCHCGHDSGPIRTLIIHNVRNTDDGIKIN